MHYSRHTYAYLLFAAGVILVNSIAYLAFGRELFAVQTEITTNWLAASILTSFILIPTYLLGLACLFAGGRLVQVDVASVEKLEFSWAFFSGALLALIPVVDFIIPSSVFAYVMNPYVITWLPIVITSLTYITVKKYTLY